MKSKKKILALALTVVMLLSLIPVQALAQDSAEPADAPAVEQSVEETAEKQEAEAPAAEEPAAEEPAEKEPAADPNEVKNRFNQYYPQNGATVSIGYADAAFPEGTEIVVRPIIAESEIDKITDSIDAAVDGSVKDKKITAFDISFWYEGKEIQPAEGQNVSVSILSAEIKTYEDPAVYHISDDGVATEVDDAKVETATKAPQAAAEFTADEFSVYAVIESIVPRLTVKFMSGSSQVAEVYVKASDEADDVAKIIYDPGAGDIDPKQVFKGWADTQNYTATSTFYTVEQIRSAAMTKADSITKDETVTYYAALFESFTITYLSDEEEPVTVGTGSVEYPSNATAPEVAYTVNQGYTVDDSHNFEGWMALDTTSQSHIKGYPAGAKYEDVVNGDTTTRVYYYENGASITVTGDITFTVKAPEGNWLIFDENGKGGKYNASKFILKGMTTSKPYSYTGQEEIDYMTRYGYTFAGWYYFPDGVAVPAQDSHKSRDLTNAVPYEFGGTINKTTTVYAKWTPRTDAPYTVIFWTQNLNKTGYEVADSYAGTNGVVGNNIEYTVVENKAEDYVTGFGTYGHYTGFGLTEASKGQEVEITPEGDAVLNLYYDRITYNFRFYLYRDGSEEGEWDYANNSGSGSSLTATNNGLVTWHIDEDNHPDVTGYTVVSEEMADGRNYYYFVMQAYYGEDISTKWPTYDKIKGADGREAVSYVMMVGTKLKPSATNQGSGTVKGIITVMNENILGATNDPDGNYVVVRFPASYYNWRYHLWFETVAGESYPTDQYNLREYNGKTYYEKKSESPLVVRSSNTDVTSQNEPKYTGFTFLEKRGDNNDHDAFSNNSNYWTITDGEGPNAVTYYHLNYVYNREQYKISYFDGQYVDGNNNKIQNRSSSLLHESGLIGQGATISDADRNYKPTLPSSEEGYVFEGWYLDEGCTQEYNWNTMPVGGIMVYAKWRQIQYRVFLHTGLTLADGNDEFSWGNDNQSLSFRADYGKTISVPEEVVRPGYKFLGWYTASGSSFNDMAYIFNEDTVDTEYDKANTPTDPETKYEPTGMSLYGPWDVKTDGARNSDLTGWNGGDRFWITKKFDLYAKWSKVLDGAPGVNVVYNAVGKDLDGNTVSGSNAPTDNAVYLDNTSVAAKPAATAPDGYIFDHWVVETYDSEAGEYKYSSTSQTVVPGKTFEIYGDDAKVEVVDADNKTYTVELLAIYKAIGEKDPTFIEWYSNYGGGKGTLYRHDTLVSGKEALSINEAVDIYGKTDSGFTTPTRDGYIFKGWTKTQGGTTADFLKWTGTGYTAEVNGTTYEVTQVAADEETPIDYLYAVWQPELFVKVTGNTSTVTYNGTEQSVTGYTVQYKLGGDGEWSTTAPDGVTISPASTAVSASGTNVNTDPGYPMGLTFAGITVNVTNTAITFTKDADHLTVTDGWLKIQPKAITITADNGKRDYDGTALTVSTFTVATLDSTDTHTFTVTMTAASTITDAGTQANVIATVDGTAVTTGTQTAVGNYLVTTADGTLTIDPKAVTLASGSKTREYNGSALTNDEVEGKNANGLVTETGWVGSEGATYTFSGSITKEGSVKNAFNYTLKEGTKASNYSISKTEGDLKITTNTTAITVQPGSGSKVYDGTALTKTEHDDFTVTGVPEGFTWTAAADGTVTNVTPGTGEKAVNAVTEFKIFKGSEDVTDQFSNITKSATGTLTITARPITIKANDAEDVYNGSTITYKTAANAVDPYYAVTSGTLADGQSITAITLTGEGVKAGTYDINITEGSVAIGTYTANYTITLQPGTLTIKQNSDEIVVVPGSGSKTYDGTPLTKTEHDDFTVTGVPSGFTWTAKADGTVTNVTPGTGEKAVNAVTEFKIFDSSNNDVTDQFSNINTKATGTLTITPVAITIKANDASNEYTGSTITYATASDAKSPYYAITSGSLVSGQSITAITLTGEGTNVGTYDITITEGSVKIGDNTGNYTITLQKGTLTITTNSDAISVTPGSGEKVYDGKPLTKTEAGDFTVTGIPDGFTWTAAADGTVTNVTPGTGEKAVNAVSEFKIFKGSDDVTDQFSNINKTATGTLTITPAELTVKTPDATKTYDGTALTADGSITGFVNSETATFKTTGTQTEVGSSKNTYTITWDGTAKQDNYKVNETIGTLTVEGTSKLTVTKETTSTPKNGKTYALDETIEYKITVTNGGELELSDIEVVDEKTGDKWTVASLTAGKSVEFTAKYVVTEKDILAGSVKNNVTAKGVDPSDDPVKDDDTVEDPTDEPNPSLTLDKETTSTPANGKTYALDETITYKITVKNDGNLTITNIEVKDEKTGDSWTIDALKPGESNEYKASYTVTEEDILAGKVVNEATATGVDPNKDPIEEDDKVEDPTDEPNPSLKMTKETTSKPANGEAYVLGEKITYKITVENDGNLTISEIKVDDEKTGDSWTIDALKPGESKEFSAEYTVVKDDVLAGKVVNEAKVTGIDPNKDPIDEDDKVDDPTDEGKVKYWFSEGDGQTWWIGSGVDAKFTISRDPFDEDAFKHFTGIEIDGKAVDKAMYDAKSGSVKLSIHDDFMEELALGKHTIKGLFDDGEAEAVFYVATEEPDTGDHNDMFLWAGVMITSMLGVLFVASRRRKEEQ